MLSLHCYIRYLVLSFVFLVSPISVFARSITLPAGWRTPTNSELNDGWRKKDPANYSVAKGDFNGDGMQDMAMLLVSLQHNEIGLFVFLAQENNVYKIFRLEVIKDVSYMQVLGIAKVLPGTYKTACGKGYWDCKPSEMPMILLKQEAIDFFKMESANSYFYWDEQVKTFRRIWMSE